MSSDAIEGPTKRVAPHGLLRQEWAKVFVFGGLGGFFCLVFTGNLRFTLFLLCLVFGAACYHFRDSLAAMRNWHAPDLEVATDGYRLGETATLRYRRAAKRATDVPSFSIRADLVCEELVRYQRGTDTETDTRRVLEQPVTGAGEGDAEGLLGEIEVYITPHVGMPTFRAEHNEVTWYVEIIADAPGLPTDKHRFEIEVVSALAGQRLQDS